MTSAYQVFIDRRFEKELARLPRDVQRRVLDAVTELAFVPRPSDSKKLKGQENIWRLRMGDYRVLYSIEDRVLKVLVLRVSHRSDVYRGL